MSEIISSLITFIRNRYGQAEGGIPLHVPVFMGREKAYLLECIDSTYVSSVGAFVDRLEQQLCTALNVRHAVAVVNGTSALHTALLVSGVKQGDEVLTQALSFVATANAISYCGASPVFLDVEESTLGLNPLNVINFLEQHAEEKDGEVFNKVTGRRISACVPMHSFGHPCRVDRLLEICDRYNIPLVEDAAEALGSRYKDRACGTFGIAGVLSFNGNKIITSGGGGAVVTNDTKFAEKARYLTTTAKKPHPYLYEHTEVGYNYRMPNLNAALACAQLEHLEEFVEKKRMLAQEYAVFFKDRGLRFVSEPTGARSNYWLNAVLTGSLEERDAFLDETNACNIYTRPAWTLLNSLPMYRPCQTDDLAVSRRIADTLVNLPSSVPLV